MRLKNASIRNGVLALTAIAALTLAASAASAGNGNGRGHQGYNRGAVRYRQQGGYYGGHRGGTSIRANIRIGGGYGYGGGYYGGGGYYRQPQRVYVRSAPRVIYAQPAYTACAPRYVTYRPRQVVLVRPAPYVRVGVRVGCVDIGAIFGPHRRYSNYDYGCNFCDAHFSSYGAYESHVQSCQYRPSNCRIQCEDWDNAGYDDYRASCERGNATRYDERDRGEYRGDDRGSYRQDDRGYQGNDGDDDRDDRGYDDEDDGN
jgi:hypothetical protein